MFGDMFSCIYMCLSEIKITPKGNTNDYLATIPSSPLKDGITIYDLLKRTEITLDKLKEEGLIEKTEEREIKDRVIYDDFKEKYYKEAFKNFRKNIF